MSALLELLNVIKGQCRPDWLTPGQATAVAAIEQCLRIPGVVNLAGPAGAGKTFCGWLLARSLAAQTTTDADWLPDKSAVAGGTLIIDNGPEDLRQLRRLLTELQLREVRCAVVITQHPNELGLPVVPLPPPTDEDCARIRAHMESHYPFFPGPPVPSLWNWIRSACD